MYLAENLDIKQAAEVACMDKCEPTWAIYKACEKRIEGVKTEKNCAGYYTDHWACIDKCAVPLYYYRLK